VTETDAMIANLRLVESGFPVATLKAMAPDVADRLAELTEHVRHLNADYEAVKARLAILDAKLPHYAKGGAFVPGVDEAWDSGGNLCSIIDDFGWDGAGGIMSKHTGAGLFYPTAAECEEHESGKGER